MILLYQIYATVFVICSVSLILTCFLIDKESESWTDTKLKLLLVWITCIGSGAIASAVFALLTYIWSL